MVCGGHGLVCRIRPMRPGRVKQVPDGRIGKVAMKPVKVIFKTDYSRKFPDPLNNNPDDDESYNIEHHIILCKASDVPSSIPMGPNSGEQKTDYGIYKKVRESLDNKREPFFHLKNKGITILAHKVEFSEDKKVATAFFMSGEGIADGGHTYEIVLESQKSGECPENQYVKFEIITGVPHGLRADVVGGLNTAVQVQEASLLNLDGKFEWIEEAIKNAPYFDKISWNQNENKEFDIRDIVALLYLFRAESEKDSHPKQAFVSKAFCLDQYKNDQKSFEKLKPILKDILYLHDYVHLTTGDRYNQRKKEQGGKGRTRAMTGIYENRERGKYQFVFMKKESQSRMFDGVLYPILGALRYLVEIKPGDKCYSWKLKSFDEVLKFYDEIAPELLETTCITSDTYNRKPNAVGKDDNHWSNLFKSVKVKYFETKQGV